MVIFAQVYTHIDRHIFENGKRHFRNYVCEIQIEKKEKKNSTLPFAHEYKRETAERTDIVKHPTLVEQIATECQNSVYISLVYWMAGR